MNIRKYSYDIFKSEVINENINNVKLYQIPLVKLNTNGYIRPNFKKASYNVVVNTLSNINMNESDRLFYRLNTIYHEIEHIKTFEKTKYLNFYDYSHFISLLEFISYLNEFSVKYDDFYLNIFTKFLINISLRRNYKISTSELKSSLEGYRKANLIINKDISSTVKSIEFLLNSMEISYTKGRLPVDKFSLYFSNASKYIKKYPNILNDYKVLLNFFNIDGTIKNIYDIYLNINIDNKELYDQFIINYLLCLNTTEYIANYFDDLLFKTYIEDLIEKYNYKVADFYNNKNLCYLYLNDKSIVNDNLKLLIYKVRKLNKLAHDYNLSASNKLVL